MRRFVRTIGYMSKLLLLGGLFGLSAGCANIPKQNFDAYRSSSATAKTAAEDVVLRGKVAAKALAEDPANIQSPTERLAKLREREQLADDRLIALETIDRYNNVLVQLAEGKDPEEIKSDLESLGNCLTKIGSSRITAAVGKAVPYAGIAAELVAMIDDATNRQKFVELVKKGSEPVSGIIDILVADADNIHTIVSQQMMMPRDISDNRLSDIRFRFKKVADGLQNTTEVADVVKRINETRARLVHQKLPTVDPVAGATVPRHADLELLNNLADATESEVVTANSITSKVKDHSKVIEEYKSLLNQTKTSLVQLGKSVELNRPVATAEYINRALTLRESIIKLREGT